MYKYKESVYLLDADEPAHPDFAKATVELYVKIFEYQLRLVCFLSKISAKRPPWSILTLEYWRSMLEEIKSLSCKCDQYYIFPSEEKVRQLYEEESSSIEHSVDIKKRVIDMFEACRTQRMVEPREADLLEALASDYKSDKDMISARVPGTCEWFFQDERFVNWRSNKCSSLLLVSAGPGCGKSVLSRALIDESRVCSNVMTSSVCYFFFKDGQEQRTNGAHALSAILHQLFKSTKLISHALSIHDEYGTKLRDSFSELWDLLIKSARDPEAGEIICILDALDECEERARKQLISKLITFFSQEDLHPQFPFRLKFLVTSRPYDTIEE